VDALLAVVAARVVTVGPRSAAEARETAMRWQLKAAAAVAYGSPRRGLFRFARWTARWRGGPPALVR